jgi:hypothetical protein
MTPSWKIKWGQQESAEKPANDAGKGVAKSSWPPLKLSYIVAPRVERGNDIGTVSRPWQSARARPGLRSVAVLLVNVGLPREITWRGKTVYTSVAAEAEELGIRVLKLRMAAPESETPP